MDLGFLYHHRLPLGLIVLEVLRLLLSAEPLLAGFSHLEQRLFDHFVDEQHLLRRLARAVDFSRIDALCRSRTPDRAGGLSPVAPLRLFKFYIVLYLFNIPGERELCRRAKADLAIRWFCGFGLVGSIPVHSTLSKFRSRMGLETFQDAFLDVLRQCAEAHLIQAEEVILDGSKLLARATPIPPAQQGSVLLQRFLEGLFNTAYVEPATEEDRPRLEAILQRVAAMVGAPIKNLHAFWPRFLGQLKPAPGAAPRLVRFARLSKTQLTQSVRKVLLTLPHAIGDPCARYGSTGEKEPFLGYLSTFAIDPYKQIITAPYLTHAAVYGSGHFHPVYAQHKQNLARIGLRRPLKRALMDKGYDQADVRQTLHQDAVQAFISPKQRHNKHGVYSTDCFWFNDKGQLICPNGSPMISGPHRARKGGTLIYRCPRPDACGDRSLCTKVKQRTVEIHPETQRRRLESLLQKETREFKDAMSRRRLIEAVFGHGKSAHHLDKALYRNELMVRIQQTTAATVMNMEKLIVAAHRG